MSTLSEMPIKLAIIDDYIIRKGIISLLSEIDEIEVKMEFNSSADFLNLLVVSDDIPTICIMDVCHVYEKGRDILKEIRSVSSKIKILIFSMSDDEVTILRIFQSGANGYMLKYCDANNLSHALKEIHESDFYISEKLAKCVPFLIRSNKARPTLNSREILFLFHVCSSSDYKQIAHLMGVSHRTVEGYRDSIFEKMGFKNKAELVLYAVRSGIVNPFKREWV